MKPPRTPAKRLLCLWLPNWPIQRWRASRDGAALDPDGPLVLWGVDPRRGRLVVACCDRAEACGVRVGMTVGEADSLVRAPASQHAPAIEQHAPLIEQHDSEADLEALRGLAEACAGELSPIVALEPLDDFLWAGQILHQPQSLLLDVTGVGELLGGESQLVAAAIELLRRHRLEGRIAIADTAGAAWGIAHYGAEEEGSSGACVVPPQQTSAALDALPVVGLRIRTGTAVMLRRLGVEQIEALRRLPRSGLAPRLGADLLRRLDQALGEVDEPLPAHHAAASDRATVDLEYPTRDFDILRHQMEGLVRQVARGLSERQRGALRLTCRFDLEQPPPLEIRIGLFTPSATADHLSRLISGNLERCRFPSPAHRIVVAATLTGPLATHQPTLGDIGGGNQASLIDLARLIDGLSSRLGRARVLGVELTDDPLPEQAVRLRPLAGQPVGEVVPGRPMPRRGRGRGRRAAPHVHATPSNRAGSRSEGSLGNRPTPADPLRRPLMMFSRPVPLTVVAAPPGNSAMEQEAGASRLPQCFRSGGRVHRIVRHWGPERLETGWWSGPLHRRDYYRIETAEGVWMWIYHDLKQNQWWLHGHFF